jgi:hypothetical protein
VRRGATSLPWVACAPVGVDRGRPVSRLSPASRMNIHSHWMNIHTRACCRYSFEARGPYVAPVGALATSLPWSAPTTSNLLALVFRRRGRPWSTHLLSSRAAWIFMQSAARGKLCSEGRRARIGSAKGGEKGEGREYEGGASVAPVWRLRSGVGALRVGARTTSNLLALALRRRGRPCSTRLSSLSVTPHEYSIKRSVGACAPESGATWGARTTSSLLTLALR